MGDSQLGLLHIRMEEVTHSLTLKVNMEEEGPPIQLASEPRPLLPPASHPILMQLLLGVHLLFTPLARFLALGVSFYRRIAISLYFLPPPNVTELAGTSEGEQLTVVDEYPALFNRKYRTYVEEGGDRQLRCSTGICQEMTIFDSEKDMKEWDRVLVSGGNSSYIFYCEDLVSSISSPFPLLVATALLLLPPILIFFLPLLPRLKTLAHHRPLLLLLPLVSSLVVAPLHCCPWPPSHISLILPLSPSILHLVLAIFLLLSFIPLLILLILHQRASKTAVLNVEEFDQKFVRLKIEI